MPAAMLLHAVSTGSGFASLYSLAALTPQRPKLGWRFICIDGLPRSLEWLKNVLCGKRVDPLDRSPDLRRARKLLKRKSKRRDTCITSVTVKRTGQVA